MFQSATKKIQNFLIDESGPTAVEYAIMLALILGLCVVSIGTLGLATSEMWDENFSQIDVFTNGAP